MSCVKVPVMPSPAGFQPLSHHTMSYRPGWSTTTTTSTPAPNPTHPPRSAPSRLLPPAVSASRSHNPHHPRPHVHGSANEIIPRLYISDLSFAENPKLLSTYRITHILSILPDTISIHPDSDAILGYKPVRFQVRVEDSPFAELAAHLPTTTKFIRDAYRSSSETRVLVHCVEGISRSASVVAAFLMAHYGWTPREAVKYVKEKRQVADPNFGFVKQLYEYGREGLGRRGLVEGM